MSCFFGCIERPHKATGISNAVKSGKDSKSLSSYEQSLTNVNFLITT